jgi:sugar phosphate isomerase/epimerase
MNKLPIALQLYSIRRELNEDFEGMLKKVKVLGYDGVEFAGLYGKKADEVRDIVEKIGLTPISAHVPLAEMLADPDGTLEQYHTIGCQYVAVPWLEEKRRPGSAEYAETVEAIKRLTGLAKKHGLQLLYHNHDFEFVKIGGEYALDLLYENIPELMTELDTCWVAVAGEDPAKYLEKYTLRAPVVHLKDYFMPGRKPDQMYELIGSAVNTSRGGEQFEFRPMGQGMQHFAKITDAAIKAGSRWFVIEQDEPSMGKTPLECAEMSIQYLRGL